MYVDILQIYKTYKDFIYYNEKPIFSATENQTFLLNTTTTATKAFDSNNKY